MNDDNDTLEMLWEELYVRKAEEASCRGKRVQVEERIAALLDGPEIGSKTFLLPSGRKLAVKRGVTYKADIDEIRKLFEQSDALSGKAMPLKSKTETVLDEKGYEWYRVNMPLEFPCLAKHVEVKPRKVAVTITEAKNPPKEI
jgi:hypothetical protein